MEEQKLLEQTTLETIPVSINACAHYWLIDSPHGPISKGVCRKCSEVRQFNNYFDGASFWDDGDSASVVPPLINLSNQIDTDAA